MPTSRSNEAGVTCSVRVTASGRNEGKESGGRRRKSRDASSRMDVVTPFDGGQEGSPCLTSVGDKSPTVRQVTRRLVGIN